MEAALGTAAAATSAFPLEAVGPRSLGRGVALAVAAAPLLELRARLARSFADWLTAQDRQGFRPHVTLQNKVAPAAARALLGELQAGFVPRPLTATALCLWRYRGGPWDALARVPLSDR